MYFLISNLIDVYMAWMSLCHYLCQVRAEICSKEEVEEEEMEAVVNSVKKLVYHLLHKLTSPTKNFYLKIFSMSRKTFENLFIKIV